jgi:cytochrome c oxidase subunit IV
MNTRQPTSKQFFAIWFALMALLFLTWGAAQFDLGRWNLVAAMTIAAAKMLLVVLVFMHVRYSARITWIFVLAGFFWLFIMVTLTMGDYLTRAAPDFR